jgi:hypothetical protein
MEHGEFIDGGGARRFHHAGCFDFSFGHIDYCLERAAAGGTTPMQALLSATGIAAAACGIAEHGRRRAACPATCTAQTSAALALARPMAISSHGGASHGT